MLGLLQLLGETLLDEIMSHAFALISPCRAKTLGVVVGYIRSRSHQRI